MNSNLLREIDIGIIDRLREIAFQAEIKYGNKGYWYNSYARGLDGLEARILGLRKHYNSIQSIGNEIKFPLSKDNIIELDHNLSDILYNMDSAIECLVFTLNAIGYGIMDSESFISIEDDKKLKTIKPDKIFTAEDNVHYKRFYPNLLKYWLVNPYIKGYVTPKKLWESIRDQHDVAKHRSRIYHSITRYKNVIDVPLDKNPKKPLVNKDEIDYDFYPWTLNDHIKEFVRFFNKSCNLISIDLNNFLNSSTPICHP